LRNDIHIYIYIYIYIYVIRRLKVKEHHFFFFFTPSTSVRYMLLPPPPKKSKFVIPMTSVICDVTGPSNVFHMSQKTLITRQNDDSSLHPHNLAPKAHVL
jgi:hypothetical protein